MFKNFSRIVALCAAITCGSSWGMLPNLAEIATQAGENCKETPYEKSVQVTAAVQVVLDLNDFVAFTNEDQTISLIRDGKVTSDADRTIHLTVKQGGNCYIKADTVELPYQDGSAMLKISHSVVSGGQSAVLKQANSSHQITFEKDQNTFIRINVLGANDGILEENDGVPYNLEMGNGKIDATIKYTVSAKQ